MISGSACWKLEQAFMGQSKCICNLGFASQRNVYPNCDYMTYLSETSELLLWRNSMVIMFDLSTMQNIGTSGKQFLIPRNLPSGRGGAFESILARSSDYAHLLYSGRECNRDTGVLLNTRFFGTYSVY
nr:hypothetical protein Iba_chr08cCG6200 [Ipomoea batatas]